MQAALSSAPVALRERPQTPSRAGIAQGLRHLWQSWCWALRCRDELARCPEGVRREVMDRMLEELGVG